MSINSVVKSMFGLVGCEIRLTKNVSKLRQKYHEGRWQSKWQLLAQQMDIRSIIDVGANTGQFAVMINKVFPDAVIYSFEPLPACFEDLKKNTAHIAQCFSYQTAMGRAPGKHLFNQSGYTPCSSFLEPTELLTNQIPLTEHVSAIEVRVDSLDRFFEKRSLSEKTLLKLDVQGFENEVILGGKTFLNSVDVIVTEVAFDPQYKKQPLFDDINALLRDFGFVYHGSIDQNICAYNSRIIEADAIFYKE